MANNMGIKNLLTEPLAMPLWQLGSKTLEEREQVSPCFSVLYIAGLKPGTVLDVCTN